MGALMTIVLLVLSAFVGASTAGSQTVSAPALTVGCMEATQQQDVDDALAVAGSAFSPALWTVNVFSDHYPSDTYVDWSSDKLDAVAHLDYLGYTCGAPLRRVQYVSPANYQIVFANWGSYQQTAHCSAADVDLVEFDAESVSGVKYHALYWLKQVAPTRVAGLNLMFPVTEQAKQADYARRLFPELPTCRGNGHVSKFWQAAIPGLSANRAER